MEIDDLATEVWRIESDLSSLKESLASPSGDPEYPDSRIGDLETAVANLDHRMATLERFLQLERLEGDRP